MKQLLLVVSMIAFLQQAEAQDGLGKRILENSKNRSINRTEQKADESVDRTLDKIEEGIDGIFRRKPGGKGGQQESQTGNDSGGDGSGSADQGSQESASGVGSSSSPVSSAGSAPNIKATLSKFDFIPGDIIIAYDNFSTDAVGDFPEKWNTNAGADVVRLDGTDNKWLKPVREGIFYIESIQTIPENTTIEFDIYADDQVSNSGAGFHVAMVKKMDRRLNYDIHFNNDPQISLNIHPYGNGDGYCNYYTSDAQGSEMRNGAYFESPAGAINRVSIWRQGRRVRLYINENKIFDLPRALDPNIEYTLLFFTKIWSGNMLVSDFRVAQSIPNTRNQLLEEGRLVSNNITFDVNSDQLKMSSYGVLKEIAGMLQSAPDMKVNIIGHTDSDGNAAANQTLSERRAEAVKRVLVNDFGIAANRLTTEGKGQSQPVAQNNSSEGKAQNRRVEFVKK